MTAGSASAVAAASGLATAGSASAATATSDFVGVGSASAAAASSGSCAAAGELTASNSSLQHDWDHQSHIKCKTSTGLWQQGALRVSAEQTNTSSQGMPHWGDRVVATNRKCICSLS